MRHLLAASLIICSLSFTSFLHAAPTPAGTVISNQVTLKYHIDNIEQTPSLSNIATFHVDEIVDVALTWQDGAPRNVSSPQKDAPLSFSLSNTGNGTATFSLNRNNALTDNAFTPTTAARGGIYLENGLQPGFQATGPNADTLYIAGSNDPTLAAGRSLTVYASSDIAASLDKQSQSGLL